MDDPRDPFVVAAELTPSRPDLIVTSGPEASLQAVMGVSGFIPVVMIAINFDPFARGYIASLARPGGNITGLVFRIGATAWMTPNWAGPVGASGSPRTATRVTPGAICLSNASHFPLMLYSNSMKPVALWPSRAGVSARATGI